MAKKASSPSTTSDDSSSHDQTQSAQQKQAMYLAQDTGHFSLVKAMHLADCITLVNGLSGFMSILSSLKYCAEGRPSNLTNLWLAFAFIPLGLLADLFDGKVARWRKKSSLMGQELDSLADLITFGVAPAAIAFSIGFRTTIDQLLLTFYVLCGLTRLARFNVTVQMLPKDKTGKSKYFEGVPVPFACFTSSTITATWSYMGLIHGSIPYGTYLKGSFLEFHPTVLIYVVCGSLMVSKTLKVPKP